MLCKGNYLTAMSGKVGGVVAAHNKGGQYMRQFRVPTNPQTAYQNAVRNAVAALSQRWTQVLTAAQRTGWAVFGANVSVTNPLGDSTLVQGLNWYVAFNTPRIQASIAVVDSFPTIFTLPTLTVPVPTLTAASTTLSLAFTNTDAWAGESGGYLLIWASRPQSPGINFFKGPFRYAGKITGSATPPTTPSAQTLPFTAGPTGSKVFFYVRSVRADGRVSSKFPFLGTV